MKKKLSGGILLAALAFVAGNEGFKSEPYRDSGGVLTDCYGRTKGVKIGVELTREQCDAELLRELIEHAKPIEKLNGDLPRGVIIAWADFCYNVGVHACQTSTGYKMLRDGGIDVIEAVVKKVAGVLVRSRREARASSPSRLMV